MDNLMTSSRVPDIYIIGAQKSGTTTLYHWLAQHPEIYAHPLAKDYPYFSNDRLFAEERRRFFSFQADAPEGLLTLGGEVNAMYVKSGANRMRMVMPNTKLIAICRDPVERAYSAYTYAVERLLEKRSLQQAIHEEILKCKYNKYEELQLDYIGHGLYAQQLYRILDCFPVSQVKVIIFEEFIERSSHILAEIFNFLGIDDSFIPDMTVHNKTRGGQRFRLLAYLLYNATSFNPLLRKIFRRCIPFECRTSLRRFLVNFNRIHSRKPDFPAIVRNQLRKYYKVENEEFERLLGRNINIWQ